MIATRLGRLAALAGLVTVIACAPNAATTSSPPASGPATTSSAPESAGAPEGGSLVIVGRIVTLSDPPIAEALPGGTPAYCADPEVCSAPDR